MAKFTKYAPKGAFTAQLTASNALATAMAAASQSGDPGVSPEVINDLPHVPEGPNTAPVEDEDSEETTMATEELPTLSATEKMEQVQRLLAEISSETGGSSAQEAELPAYVLPEPVDARFTPERVRAPAPVARINPDMLVVVVPVRSLPKVRIGKSWLSFTAGVACRVPYGVKQHLVDKGIVGAY